VLLSVYSGWLIEIASVAVQQVVSAQLAAS